MKDHDVSPHADESKAAVPAPPAARSSDRPWRSFSDLARDPDFLERAAREFPAGASELAPGDDSPDAEVSRRSFLTLMGASLALAGLNTTGCIRKPAQEIYPFTRRPEDLVPGRPLSYATVGRSGHGVVGLLVETQDGRPTKVDGNPDHPNSLGGSSPWMQASVLALYDPARSRTPLHDGREVDWAAALDAFEAALDAHSSDGGRGLALLSDARPSPTYRRLLGDVKRRFPQARVYVDDPSEPTAEREGLASVGLNDAHVVNDLREAQVIVSLDSDFLLVDSDAVRLTREFADGRRVATPGDPMNRLYVVEPGFSTTGAAADNRLRVKPSEVATFTRALLAELGQGSAPAVSGDVARWAREVAADLRAHRGRCAVLAGHRQPAEVHAAAAVANQLLGNVGRTVRYLRDEHPMPRDGALADLVSAATSGSLRTLVVLGGNPVYTAPGDLGLAAALERIPTRVHHGAVVDETAAACNWHLPASHPFEAWGDLVSGGGDVSIQQPLIAPMFGTRSELEILALAAGRGDADASDLVRETWRDRATDTQWRQWLHDGVGPTGLVQDAGAPRPGRLPAGAEASGTELVFWLDATLYDGRWANSGWLQELPDPMTKLTWDNAAAISPATAAELGVESGDMVRVSHGGREITIGAWVTPGLADGTVLLPLGYGRTRAGDIGNGVGVDVNPLRSAASPWIATGASVAKASGRHVFASTQEHGTLDTDIENFLFKVDQPTRHSILREATAETYASKPEFVEELEVMPPGRIHSLWQEPNETSGQQWGMSIDLTTCVGCNACTIACQAENNISVVGKEQVLNGREMHWIRLDRYYSGSPEDPTVSHQPLPCMQCENAPCESVCPVAATVHGPEGTNDMAYNRCIGTRYCSNNCPYKVRRFNFFNYSKRNDEAVPLLEAQRNQNVTVRFRGVMEKCTYCVQRINAARIEAKVQRDGFIRDGEVKTACQEACPSKAIAFGDIKDAKSEVARLKAQPRDYGILAELNTKPRTTYLAKLRNPNPALAPAPAPAAGHADGH